jgi:cell division protein FtsQ
MKALGKRKRSSLLSRQLVTVLDRFFMAGERLTGRRDVRFAVRGGAVAMLGLTIAHGLIAGGHIKQSSDGTRGLQGQVSSYFGYAAEQIRVTGLKRKTAATVLKIIGVKPGGTLLGFDAGQARETLLNVDWVKSASVRVVPPNRLEVELEEREPFAIWQRDGLFYVIDREGTAMGSFDARLFPHLMLVTGEGAQDKTAELVNQLEVWPELKSRVRAAARVGQRRWSLYFGGDREVMLPETGVQRALAELAELDSRFQILASGIRRIDLRLAGSAVLHPFGEADENHMQKLAERAN